MPMQLKWQHCSPFSPAPSRRQAQACWQNALSRQHGVKLLLELLKQELWNPSIHKVTWDIAFIFFCRQPRDRFWSNGGEAGVGGKEKRGKPDCGFSSTQVFYGPLCSRAQTGYYSWERRSRLSSYTCQSASLTEGQLAAYIEEVPEMGPYRSWVSKSWRPSKTPFHPARFNCKVSGPAKHISSSQGLLAHKKGLRLSRFWSLGALPVGTVPSPQRHPHESLVPQNTWSDICPEQNGGW